MCPFFVSAPGYQYGTRTSSGTLSRCPRRCPAAPPAPCPPHRDALLPLVACAVRGFCASAYGCTPCRFPSPALTSCAPACPSSRSSSLACGRVLRWWKLAQMSLCLKSDASSWLEAWVLRKSGSNNMTGRECARALRGAWCRVLASCNSGSAPRRGSGCTELWAGVPNVNKFGAFRRSFKCLKSST